MYHTVHDMTSQNVDRKPIRLSSLLSIFVLKLFLNIPLSFSQNSTKILVEKRNMSSPLKCLSVYPVQGIVSPGNFVRLLTLLVSIICEEKEHKM